MNYKLISHVVRNHQFLVYKIHKVSYHERLFCILDTEQPFELSLIYKEPNTFLECSPIIGARGGFQLQEKINFEKTYIFRFETEEECKCNTNEIEKKKDIISKILADFTDSMMLDHNKKTLKRW